MGTAPGVAFFEAALALAGVPFRLHGRAFDARQERSLFDYMA